MTIMTMMDGAVLRNADWMVWYGMRQRQAEGRATCQGQVTGPAEPPASLIHGNDMGDSASVVFYMVFDLHMSLELSSSRLLCVERCVCM